MKRPLSASDIAAFREHARKWGGVVHTSPAANVVRLARDDIDTLADSHDLLTANIAAQDEWRAKAESLLRGSKTLLSAASFGIPVERFWANGHAAEITALLAESEVK